MPTSEAGNITPIIKAILTIQPKSILDLGIGCGKYGALCREYLDLTHGRVTRATWETAIVGIEGWPLYSNPMWDMYDDVIEENFSEHYEGYTGYDLVLLIDSLEHVEKAVGLRMLETLLQNNKYVIVSCPWGANYLEQGAVGGNEYERHRAHWKPQDFLTMGCHIINMQVCVVAVIKGAV